MTRNAEKNLRVALVHDWLTGVRGGEKVLRRIARRYPDATVYTMFATAEVADRVVPGHPLKTSVLQGIPGILRHYRSLLPLFPAAVGTLKIEPCDLVISTSHCVAKSVRVPPGARHLCYCFTPMRYVWTMRESYFHRSRWKASLARPVLDRLREWDRRTASRVDRFVAISRHVAARIRNCYGREADVVYPAVEVADYPQPDDARVGDRYLVVSALVPYKRVDLAVEAFNRLGKPLDVIGTGGDEKALRRMAGPGVRLLGWRSDEEVREAYRTARALVFPGEEDFGLVPVESQICGRPVVAYGVGGATETVVPGKTGVLFPEQTVESLMEAVERSERIAWDSAAIRQWAERFGPERFEREFSEQVAKVLE